MDTSYVRTQLSVILLAVGARAVHTPQANMNSSRMNCGKIVKPSIVEHGTKIVCFFVVISSCVVVKDGSDSAKVQQGLLLVIFSFLLLKFPKLITYIMIRLFNSDKILKKLSVRLQSPFSTICHMNYDFHFVTANTSKLTSIVDTAEL